MLFDNEVKDASENLESVGKKKNRGKSSRHDSIENKPMHVTIFLPCVSRKKIKIMCTIYIICLFRIVAVCPQK